MGDYSIAVVGLGDVGAQVAVRIARMEPVGNSRVSTLYLCSRDKEKAIAFAKKPIDSKVNLELICLEELADARPDIVINAASVEKEKIPQISGVSIRRCMGIANLELNRKIARNVPENSAYHIITNHPLLLSEDTPLTCGKNPDLVTGSTHLDTLRAREIIKFENKHLNINPSGIFVIGSHDENEMVIATNCLVNGLPLEEMGFLKGKISDIERAVSEEGFVQMKHTKTTSPETAKAAEDFVRAAISGKEYVTAAVLCDFDDIFFKCDNDYGIFEKPRRRLYLSMPVRFRNLKADLPELDWFAKQPHEVKKRFYEIARKQELFMDGLRAEGKISGYAGTARKPHIILQEKVLPSEHDALSVASGKTIAHIRKNGIGIESIAEGIRKIGYIGDEFYVASKKSVLIENKTFEYSDYEGKNGINSVEIYENILYATHSDLGLLVSEGSNLKKVFPGPARSLAKIGQGLFFISKNKIYNVDNLKSPVYEKISGDELVALQSLDGIIVSAEKYGKIHQMEKIGGYFHTTNSIMLPVQRIYCSEPFEDGVAFGTENGVFVYYPGKGI